LLTHNLESGPSLRRRKRLSCNRRAHALPTRMLFRSMTGMIGNSEYSGFHQRPQLFGSTEPLIQLNF
jgi:hypothetical protein